MKKQLLGLSLAMFALAPVANSQVILTENFDGATAPALPASWTMTSSSAPGYVTGLFATASATWGTATGTTVAGHATQIVYIDDYTVTAANNLHDTLFSPTFDLTGYSAPWLNFECYFFNAQSNTSPYPAEEAKVIGSMDGGATWTEIGSIIGQGFNESWVTIHADISSLGTGPNRRIGITYSDDGGRLLGIAIDDLEIVNLTTYNAAVTSIDYNSKAQGVSADGQSVSFVAQNTGMSATSIIAKYTVNGGTPITQTFSGITFPSYSTQKFTFTTPISGSTAGTNTIEVTLTEVNTSVNTDVDSALTATYVKASATTNRHGLIEEFSSSTCAPCKSFNQNYDPLGVTNGVNTPSERVNMIKYQMNWPNPGTDFSYNPHGLTRRTYYNCNSIPDHFVNGINSTVPASPFNAVDFTAEMDASKADVAFMDMNMTYTVDTVSKKLGVVLNVTPHFTKTGNYHVYIAVMDKYYENSANTTGQLKYYHVMRTMLPNGNGNAVTSWTDGTPQTFTFTDQAFTYGNWVAGASTYPTQGSFKLWANPLLNSEVVAFVQNDANKSILQSLQTVPGSASTEGSSFVTSTAANIEDINLYPNPAADETHLTFTNTTAGDVRVAVMDYTGKVLIVAADQKMNAGTQNINISTKNLVPGNYIVVISSATGSRADRLTITK